ncbi:MAG: BMP family ABC transporter substrate-binding protein, partial [Clostridia bacterium]|nr:BMP family ABC transporter substrate-binding protein [Clostridia bacterium]
YTDNVQSVLDGTWTNASYWEGLAAGWVDLDTLSALAPEGAQEAVDAARKAIESGELKLFSGDVYGQDGTVKATDMTDDEIYNMDWFVQGVVGTLPTA